MDALTDLARPVANLLRARGETVAVAESAAGGLISAALLALPGASAYYLGGGVIYTAKAKEVLAAFNTDEMADFRSATEPYAQLMAFKTRERLGATWGLAETGASGPKGNRYGDAPGHACLAVAGPVERVKTLETGRAGRVENMWAFASAALALLEKAIRDAG